MPRWRAGTARSVLVQGCGTLPCRARRRPCAGRGSGAVVAAARRREHAPRTARPGPTLVVLAAAGALDAAGAQPWLAAAAYRVLPVVLHGAEAVVGPLVRARAGPCLRCLDLTRADLDPAWPALLGQLAPAPVGRGPEASAARRRWSGAAAAMAAMVALAVLDGQPLAAGRVRSRSRCRGRGVRQRQWEVAPAVRLRRHGCHRSGHPPTSTSPAQARMAG